jgi:two-component system, LuxR family, response regulator FixJ
MPEGRIIVIDDHPGVRRSLRALLETEDYRVADYASAEDFFAAGVPLPLDCLLVDIKLPGMNGLELLEELNRRRWHNPMIVISGNADVPAAVRAMKAGALDILEKPFEETALLECVARALEHARAGLDESRGALEAAARIATLTGREKDVLDRLVLGESNKLVGRNLGISARTVEIHRANIQRKLNCHSLSDVIRVARLAGEGR